tara:strand:+ start:6497 stop:7288 length:792 start_codon:yes stop_codon:yes gene_type:complete
MSFKQKQKRSAKTVSNKGNSDTRTPKKPTIPRRKNVLNHFLSPFRGKGVVLKGRSFKANTKPKTPPKNENESQKVRLTAPISTYEKKNPLSRKKAFLIRRPNSILSKVFLHFRRRRVIGAVAHAERLMNRLYVEPSASTHASDFNRLKRGLLYVTYTKTNFIFTFTDIDGNVLSRVSSGSMGLDKFTRGSAIATLDATKQVSLVASQKGIVLADIIFRGSGFQNYRITSVLKGLRHSKIGARRVKKDLRTPHGGCRLKKHRRV